MKVMSDSGRNQEFVRLWTGNGQRVYAYILALLPNRADADEIFQETGMTLWEKFDEFEVGTNFRAWACRIAMNKVRNFRQLRRLGTVLLSNESLDRVGQTIMARSDELDSQHTLLADCYAQLSPRDRELIDLRYQPGVTIKDLARRLGRGIDAIYKSLARIHQLLFNCIRSAIDREGKL